VNYNCKSCFKRTDVSFVFYSSAQRGPSCMNSDQTCYSNCSKYGSTLFYIDSTKKESYLLLKTVYHRSFQFEREANPFFPLPSHCRRKKTRSAHQLLRFLQMT
jgi:hypothetical protein